MSATKKVIASPPAIPANQPDVALAPEVAANQPMIGAAFAHLVWAVDELTAEVASLRSVLRAMRSAAPSDAHRLVSMREAARLLGVSRTRTLPALLRQRGVRAVNVGGRTKVPMSEIERIGREGVDSRGALLPLAAAPKRTAPTARSRAPLARDLV